MNDVGLDVERSLPVCRDVHGNIMTGRQLVLVRLFGVSLGCRVHKISSSHRSPLALCLCTGPQKVYPYQESLPATAPWPTARTPCPTLKKHEAVNTPSKQERNEDQPAQWRWTWEAVSLTSAKPARCRELVCTMTQP